MLDTRETVTQTLMTHAPGGTASARDLLPLVYDELRNLAARSMQSERPGHTMEPTALVHEAFLRLVDETRVDWNGRTHFFAVAATSMRRVLIEHARRRVALKRGGDRARVVIHEDLVAVPSSEEDLLALDEALEQLAARSSVQARVVEMRYFGGMSAEEVAGALGCCERTVRRHWVGARAWLRRNLAEGAEPA